jgi:two-component system response regulator MprA
VSERAYVLVVDDDARIAAAVRRALVYEGFEAEAAGDGERALRMAAERPPDLVILDVLMPGLDGIEVCRRLRQAGDVPILMLTAKDGTADRVRGLDSGADDYLVKPFAYAELMARVRALLRRGAPSGRRELRHQDLVVDVAAREVRRGERPIELSYREFELLRLFVTNPRRVLTREQILDAVWGQDSEAVSNVVDVYVGYLRRKLGEPELIRTLRGAGYRLG